MSDPRPASPVSLAIVITVVSLFAFITFALGVGASIIIAVRAQNEATATAKHAAAQIIIANEKSALGRSKSLCFALKDMAETHAAHKLHPVFVHVYQSTQCHEVAGLLPASAKRPYPK